MANNIANWGSLLGSPSNWTYDAARNRMLNTVTGHTLDLTGTSVSTANNTWTSTGTATEDFGVARMQREILSLTQQVAEYDALRIYLGVNHKDILVEFDVAYAARKRLGVGDKP